MKKMLLVILVLLTSLVASSKDNDDPVEKENNPDVVINHEMITRFNDIEYDENTITFRDLSKSYSIEDAKLIYHAYVHGDMTIENKEITHEILAEIKAETKDPENEIKQTLFISKR